MVTSSFQASADTSSTSGKPELNQTSGPSDYYLIPVAGLKSVTVNGVDMSKDIKNGAIAVHTKVIDEGEIIIKSKEGAIVITAPSRMSCRSGSRIYHSNKSFKLLYSLKK